MPTKYLVLRADKPIGGPAAWSTLSNGRANLSIQTYDGDEYDGADLCSDPRNLAVVLLAQHPQYCRATPTECLPLFGNQVASMFHKPPVEKSILGTTCWLTRLSISASDHSAFARK
jgi:hypothetical protein